MIVVEFNVDALQADIGPHRSRYHCLTSDRPAWRAGAD
jgi:hypothetical protein